MDKELSDMTDEELDAEIAKLAGDGQQAQEEPQNEPPKTQETPKEPEAGTPAGPEEPKGVEERLRELERELQRYRSESGRHRKAYEENRELKRRIRELEEAKAREPEQPFGLSELTDEERAVLGDEPSAVLDRRNREMNDFARKLQERERALNERMGAYEKREAQRQTEAMLDAVEARHGKEIWEAEDTPEWQDWCDKPNPYYDGRTNGEVFYDAYDGRRTRTVIQMLGDFKRDSGWGEKPSEAPRAATSTPVQGKSANLGVSPNVSRASASPATGMAPESKSRGPKITAEYIQSVYDRANRDPAWANSDEGRAALDAIDTAVLGG